MAESRVIKRYANRKLYDTQRSRYVTLEQIADMIRSGDDVKIVDNNSKEDLTSVTLAQIIFEEEKSKKSILPLSALRNIIQTSGESLSELGLRVRSVFRRPATENGEANGEGGEEGSAEVHSAGGAQAEDGASENGESHTLFREFLERSQQTFDEWQKRVDERVQKVVETLAPWTVLQKELQDLSSRLVELERKLEESEPPEAR